MRLFFTSKIGAVLTAGFLTFLLFSCAKDNTGNPVNNEQTAYNPYGFVEGYITDNKAPSTAVIYSTATANSGTLNKSFSAERNEALNPDSLGYFRLTLLEGTYTLKFYKSLSSSYSVTREVVVTAGATVALNVDLSVSSSSGGDIYFTLYGDKVVNLDWYVSGYFFNVFRSTDSTNWTQLYYPSASYTGYSTYNSYYYDTVANYGTYFYKYTAFTNGGDSLYSSRANKFTVSPPVPTIYAYDSLQYALIGTISTVNLVANDYIIIFRGTDSLSTYTHPLDTLYLFTSPSSGYPVYYRDYSLPNGVSYYAVQVFHNQSGSQPSRAIKLNHSTRQSAPVILSAVDSGMYVKLQIQNQSASQFPIIVFRTSSSDTSSALPVDTVVFSSPTLNGVCRDYYTGTGTYMYSAARLGVNNELGYRSNWITVSITEAPGQIPTPTFALQASAGIAQLIINRTDSAAIFVIERSFGSQGNDVVLDSMNASTIAVYHYDSLSLNGLYIYRVLSRSASGKSSKPSTLSIMNNATPATPGLSLSKVQPPCIMLNINLPEAVTAIEVYRSQGTSANYSLRKTIPQSAYQSKVSFSDTVSATGEGMYFYKIRTIKGALASDYSVPVTVYYSDQITVVKPIYSPRADTVIMPGSYLPVYWDTAAFSGYYVNISLYKGTTLVTQLASSTYNDGYASNSLSSSLTLASDYVIKIENSSNTQNYEFGNYFSVMTPSSSDAYESDNDTAHATMVAVNGGAQSHNLIPYDYDWLRVRFTYGQHYTISTGGSTDVFLYLYSTNTTSYLAYDDNSVDGINARISYTCSTTGTYYIRVMGYNNSQNGAYTVSISNP